MSYIYIVCHPHPRTLFSLLFRERGRGKESETSISVSLRLPDGDQTCNLGEWPDQESNLQHFGAWDDAPTD